MCLVIVALIGLAQCKPTRIATDVLGSILLLLPQLKKKKKKKKHLVIVKVRGNFKSPEKLNLPLFG